MAIPEPCQAIQDQIDDPLQRIDLLTEQLQDAAPPQKPPLIRKIVALYNRIAILQDRLDECTSSHAA